MTTLEVRRQHTDVVGEPTVVVSLKDIREYWLIILGGIEMNIRCLLAIVTGVAAINLFPSAVSSVGAEACSGPRDSAARGRIVGGWKSDIKNWDGLVTLRLRNKKNNNIGYFCGGSLIAPGWVLTAAHCVDHNVLTTRSPQFKSELDNFTAFAKHGLSGPGIFEIAIRPQHVDGVPETALVQADKIYMYNYKGRKYINPQRGDDIALIKLKTRISAPLARLSLGNNTDPLFPDPTFHAMVAGVGKLRFDTGLSLFKRAGAKIVAGSKSLREVDVPTVSTSICKKRYPRATIGDGQVCAGFQAGKKDSCQGDSGGPLVSYDRHGCPYQIGVVSWGDNCAAKKSYGVYTKVSAYADWILKTLDNDKNKVRRIHKSDARDKNARKDRVRLADRSINKLAGLLDLPHPNVQLKVLSHPEGKPIIGNEIEIGGTFLFEVTPDISGQLFLVDIDANGQIVQIFPNQFTGAKSKWSVKKGQKYIIPSNGYDFDYFRAELPKGRGRLIAAIVPDDFDLPEFIGDQERLGRGFRPEKAPSGYFANLFDQLESYKGNRGFRAEKKESYWGLSTLDYTFVAP